MSKTTSESKAGYDGGVWYWVAAAGGALLLSAVVGVGVYYALTASHNASIEDRVQARLDEDAAAQTSDQGPPPSQVKVAQVEQRTGQQRIQVIGRLQEIKRSLIASEVEGRVIELLTPAGRDVVGGETVIARVDPVWAELAIDQARADLAAAKATAQQSANDLASFERLAQRGSADPRELDNARAQAAADEARVLALEAALGLAQVARQRAEIIAPFDGVVSKKLTEKGQWLDPGSSVVEIISTGEIDAVIDVPEKHITSLKKGTPVQVTVEALNQTINGEVVAINRDGLNPARTYPVKVRFDDRDGLFKVGMSVTATIPVNESAEHLYVPRDAVQYADNGPQVWMSVVMPDSAPGSMPQGMPMDVSVLFGDGDYFAVRPEPKIRGMTLRPGMDVVVEGAERLWPTRPLIVMNAKSGPGGPDSKPGPEARGSQAAPAEDQGPTTRPDVDDPDDQPASADASSASGEASR